MIPITHAGEYKLAYDRLNNSYGEIEPHPDVRVFYGRKELKEALDNWAGILPEVVNKPKYILTAGLYVEKAGAHNQGVAIDVDGFWRSPDDSYMALTAPNNWKFYLKIEATLRMSFGVVLNYDYNIAHRDHWHCDLTEKTGWRPGSRARTLFVQRSLNEFWNAQVEVNGVFGQQTQDALKQAEFNFPEDWEKFIKEMVKKPS